MPVQFARLDGVELVSVGTWDASTGRCTFTPDDLQAAVAAFNDQLVDRPPIKLGHDDVNAFNATLSDGEPAFGWIENVRVSADGNTLVGDLVGIPAKLAEIIPTAFRKRSVELAFGVRTAAGKVYRCVLTGIALLGAMPPAVKGLADLLALYSGSTPEGTHHVTFSGDTPTLPPVRLYAADGVGTTPPTGRTSMKLTPELRTALGLTDQSSDDDVSNALKAAGLSVLPVAEPVNPAPAAEPATPVTPAAPTAVVEPVTPAAPAEPVAAAAAPVGPALATVDAASLTALTARSAAMETELAAIRAGRDAERRDAILATAVRAGKLHPQVAASCRPWLDTDEAAAVKFLNDSPVLFPTTPVGHALLSADQANTVTEAVKARHAQDLTFLGLTPAAPAGKDA